MGLCVTKTIGDRKKTDCAHGLGTFFFLLGTLLMWSVRKKKGKEGVEETKNNKANAMGFHYLSGNIRGQRAGVPAFLIQGWCLSKCKTRGNAQVFLGG